MKKYFSAKWASSRQPRKQRKYRYNVPLHIRQKLLAAHLSKNLRKEYKKRSIPVRVGDEVAVMRGSFRKQKGKVTGLNMKNLKIFIENVKRKRVKGQEVQVPIDPSNVLVTALDLSDKRRLKFLKRKGVLEKKDVEGKIIAK